jgi:GTP cyclohydrolase I
MKKVRLSWDSIRQDIKTLHQTVLELSSPTPPPFKIYGIPRGGTCVALLWKSLFSHEIILVDEPEQADFFIDDIQSTGKTKEWWETKYDKNCMSLYHSDMLDNAWIIFPWESTGPEQEMGPEENIRRALTYIGEDPSREGLIETPKRVIKSWERLYGGYNYDGASIQNMLKVFENDSSDEMVVLKNIEFYSTCEHHMLPFFGKAHIAYIPNGKIVGISKLARILEVYSRRLQIQERLCKQVTEALMTHLNPLGAACVLEAQHFCMVARGVEKQNSIMVTSSLDGVFKSDSTVRAEYYQLIGRS